MHPDAATLLAYRDGELSPPQARRISRHLDWCSECRLRADLEKWQIGRLSEASTGADSTGGEIRRARFVSFLRSLRSSRVAVTPALAALLLGRRASSRERDYSPIAWNRRPLAITIFAATALHLVAGLATWCAWQLTGRSDWVRNFFHSGGDLFLADLSAVTLYLNLQVWRGFTAGEPLYKGWSLITVSSACGFAGSVFSKLLATHPNPLWATLDPQDLLKFGLMIGGPLQMVTLTCGFFSILRTFHRAGIMNNRFTPVDWVLVTVVGAYTLCEGYQVVLAIIAGKLATLHDFIIATNDPLLTILLICAILLRRSVPSFSGDYIKKSWTTYVVTICSVSLGNMMQWSINYGYLPIALASIGWYIWFVAGAGYAVAAGLQLEAMGHCVDGFAPDKICAGSSAMRR